MVIRTLGRLSALAITGLMLGCGYAVSLNERVVYTPPSLFTDYQIADVVLRNCIEQSIIDQGVAQASALKRLNCSHAGINSLEGIEVFTGIEELNLAENNLTDISQLSALSQLKVVLLGKNRLQSAAPLLALLRLQKLDLNDNPSLPCEDITQLQDNYAGQQLALLKPTQCS